LRRIIKPSCGLPIDDSHAHRPKTDLIRSMVLRRDHTLERDDRSPKTVYASSDDTPFNGRCTCTGTHPDVLGPGTADAQIFAFAYVRNCSSLSSKPTDRPCLKPLRNATRGVSCWGKTLLTSRLGLRTGHHILTKISLYS
jgi:hypothetical protein